MNMKTPVALLAAVAALGLAACGSDDKSDGGGGKLAKTELVKQASAICTASEAKIKGIKQPSNIADANEAAPYFAEISKVAQEQHTKLKALQPADDVKADYDTFLAEEEKAFALLSGLATAAKEKDAAKGAQLMKQVQDNTTYEAAASKLGLKSCAA